MTTPEMDKLQTLHTTLGNVENELLRRQVARRDADLEAAVDVINDLAAQGHVDICPCDDEEPAADGK